MSHRITVNILRSGQPRPYADTELVARVTFEHQGMAVYKNPNAPFIPWDLPEERVKGCLPHVFAGYTDVEPTCWADTRLEYLRKTEPGVWEFKTRTPFTD